MKKGSAKVKKQGSANRIGSPNLIGVLSGFSTPWATPVRNYAPNVEPEL